jgi:TatD DNase family protein
MTGSCQLFDTHAHYDDRRFSADRHDLLASLPMHGICGAVNPGCCLPTTRAAFELAEAYPHVWAAPGAHPHEAARVSEAGLAELANYTAHPRCVAVGEIGLDYHCDHSPRDVQRRVFRAMMALARDTDLPALIHDREAHADAMAIIREFPSVRGVFHCYSGSWEQAADLVRLGYYISFPGVVTYPNARKPLEVAARLPSDRILLETDAPYLTPMPHRGKRNDSRFLVHTAEAIAKARGVETGAFIRQTTENAIRFFRLEGYHD